MQKTNGITVVRISMILVVAFMARAAAVGQEVRTNYMPGTDFSKYHTYKWVDIAGGAHPNQIVDAEIKQAVDSQLAAKGLTKTDRDSANMYVGYQTAVDQEKQWNAWGTGRGFGGGMGSATSSTINVGTLVLDMYDPTSKQLIWTGHATKTIDPSKSQEKTRRIWTRPWRSY